MIFQTVSILIKIFPPCFERKFQLDLQLDFALEALGPIVSYVLNNLKMLRVPRSQLLSDLLPGLQRQFATVQQSAFGRTWAHGFQTTGFVEEAPEDVARIFLHVLLDRDHQFLKR